MRKKSHIRKHPEFIFIIAALIVVVFILSYSLAPQRHFGMQNATTTPDITATSTDLLTAAIATSSPGLSYITIINSCGPYYGGTCVNMRSGPGKEFTSVLKLRNGIVLKVADIVTATSGETWYKIDPGANIRYPERIKSDWYVSSDAAEQFYINREKGLEKGTATTTKRILVSVSKQMLYAFDGGSLYMEQPISTGLDLTPTQRGVFEIFWKTPSRYMQGPIPGESEQMYDLPGVPWDLYFTSDGAAIHGAYWHDHFGQKWSHGCVNLPPNLAKKIYEWADLGTQVIITE